MYYKSKSIFKRIQSLLNQTAGASSADGNRSSTEPAIATELQRLLDEHADLLAKISFVAPSKDLTARSAISKASTEPITFECLKNIVVDQSIVTEALILSDLFELNEFYALSLIIEAAAGVDRNLFGRHNRGLVAVILFSKAQNYLVKTLHALISFCLAEASRKEDDDDDNSSQRSGSECAAKIRQYFAGLFLDGFLPRVLDFLAKWTCPALIERLEQAKALGFARHRKIIQTTWECSRVMAADIILHYCYSESLTYADVKVLLTRLCQIESDGSALDQADAKIALAFLASSNLDKDRTAEGQSLYSNIRNDNAWKSSQLAVVVQFGWAVTFAKTPARPNLNRTLAVIIEGLEDLLDNLVSNNALYYVAQMLVRVPGMLITKPYAEILHSLTSSFIVIFMPKLREMVMCSLADRNVPSRRKGDYDATEACRRLGQLFLLLQELYGKQYAQYNCAIDYWSDFELTEYENDTKDETTPAARRVDRLVGSEDTAELFKFIRLMCEELGPELMPMFVHVIARMAESAAVAQYCHRFLQGRRSRRMSYDALFSFLADIVGKFQHQQQLQQQIYIQADAFNLPPNNTMRSSTPSSYNAVSPASSSNSAAAAAAAAASAAALTITREEYALLNSAILLLRNLLLGKCPASVEIICAVHDTQPFLHQLLCCPLPVVLKAHVLSCIDALAATSPSNCVQVLKALSVMRVLPVYNKPLPSSASSQQQQQPQQQHVGGLQVEIEEYEFRQKEFPLTLALVKLATTLVRDMSDFVLLGYLTEQEISTLSDCIRYLVERVFLPLHLRQYRSTSDKYELVRACVGLIDAALRNLAHGAKFSEAGLCTLKWHPGLRILLDLLQKSTLLATFLYLLQDCRKILLEEVVAVGGGSGSGGSLNADDESVVYDIARQALQVLILASVRQSDVLEHKAIIEQQQQSLSKPQQQTVFTKTSYSEIQPLAEALQAVVSSQQQQQYQVGGGGFIAVPAAATGSTLNSNVSNNASRECEAVACVASFIQFCHENVALSRAALILFRELVLGGSTATAINNGSNAAAAAQQQAKKLARYYTWHEDERQDLVAGFYSCINAPGNEKDASNINSSADEQLNDTVIKAGTTDVQPITTAVTNSQVVLLRLESLRTLTMFLRGTFTSQIAHIILGIDHIKQQQQQQRYADDFTTNNNIRSIKSRSNIPFSDQVSIEAEFQYVCLASLFAWLERGAETFVNNSRTLSLCMDAVVYLIADSDTNKFLFSLREAPLQHMDLKLIEYLTLCTEDDDMQLTTFSQQANFQVLLTLLLRYYVGVRSRTALNAVILRLFSEPPPPSSSDNNDDDENNNNIDAANNNVGERPSTALCALIATLDRIIAAPKSVDTLDLRVISRDYVRQQLTQSTVAAQKQQSNGDGCSRRLYDTEYFLRSLIAIYSGGSQAAVISTWSLQDLQHDFAEISQLLTSHANYMITLNDKRQCCLALLQLLAGVIIACETISPPLLINTMPFHSAPGVQLAAIALDLCNALLQRLSECLSLLEAHELSTTLLLLTNAALMVDKTVPPTNNEYARQLEQSTSVFDEILVRERAALLRSPAGQANFMKFVRKCVEILTPSSSSNNNDDISVLPSMPPSSLALRSIITRVLLNCLKFFTFNIEPTFSDESAVYASDVLEFKSYSSSSSASNNTLDVLRSAYAEFHALLVNAGETLCLQALSDMRSLPVAERARHVTLVARCISLQPRASVHYWQQVSFKDVSEEFCSIMSKLDFMLYNVIAPSSSASSAAAAVAATESSIIDVESAFDTLLAAVRFHIDLVVEVDGGAQYLLFSDFIDVLTSFRLLKLMPATAAATAANAGKDGSSSFIELGSGLKASVKERLSSLFELVLSTIILIVQETTVTTAASARVAEKIVKFFSLHSTLLVGRLKSLLLAYNNATHRSSAQAINIAADIDINARRLRELRLIGDFLHLLPPSTLSVYADSVSNNNKVGKSNNAAIVTNSMQQVRDLYLTQLSGGSSRAAAGTPSTWPPTMPALPPSSPGLFLSHHQRFFITELAPLLKASTFDAEWRWSLDGIIMLANITTFLKQCSCPQNELVQLNIAELMTAGDIGVEDADAAENDGSAGFEPLFCLARQSTAPSSLLSAQSLKDENAVLNKVSLYDMLDLFMLLSNHLCKRTNDVIDCNKKMRSIAAAAAASSAGGAGSSMLDRDVRFAVDSAALESNFSTMDSVQMYIALLKRHVAFLLAYCEKCACALEAVSALICSHLEYYASRYGRERRRAIRFAREHQGKTLRPFFIGAGDDEYELLEHLQGEVRGDLGKTLVDYMSELSKTILAKSAMLDVYRTKVEVLRAQLDEFDLQCKKLEQQRQQQSAVKTALDAAASNNSGLKRQRMLQALQQQQQQNQSPGGGVQSPRRVLQWQ